MPSLTHNEFRDCQSAAQGPRLCVDVLPLYPMLGEPSAEVAEAPSSPGSLWIHGTFGLPPVRIKLSLGPIGGDRLDLAGRVGSGYLNVRSNDGRSFSLAMTPRLRRDLRRAARRMDGGPGISSPIFRALQSMSATLRHLV